MSTEEDVKKDPFSSDGRREAESQPGGGHYQDGSDTYANTWDNFIQFTSVISKTSVKFKAFLTGFSDEYKSEWNSEQVYGRNDPIQTFKNTTRTISIEWDSPAGSANEAKTNMIAAAALTRMLYPGYTKTGNVTTINRAPVIKVKFRNLISDSGDKPLLVTLAGITFSPDLEAGFFDHFEPASEDNSGTANKKLELMPKLLKFSCTMTVLHRETIGWNEDGSWPDDLKRFPNLPPSPAAPDLDNTSDTAGAAFDSASDAYAGVTGLFSSGATDAASDAAAKVPGLQLGDKAKTTRRVDRLKNKSERIEQKILKAGGESELAFYKGFSMDDDWELKDK